MQPTIAEHSKHAKFPASHTKKHQNHNQKKRTLESQKNQYTPAESEKQLKNIFSIEYVFKGL